MFNKIWKRLPDADDVFAYDTVKEVRVLDRRLGLVYYSVLNLILFYVLIYVFMIEKKYQDNEKSSGWVLARASGYAEEMIVGGRDKAAGLPIDLFDLSNEQNAAFLPTRILFSKSQENKNTNSDADFCASPLHTCKTPADCEIENPQLQKGDTCTPEGKCLRRQWCPAECDPVSDAACTTTQEIEVDPLAYEIRFGTSVHFHKFQMDVSTTEEKQRILYPKKKANTYKVKDLLRMANVDANKIAKHGALLLVTMLFDCEMDDSACLSSVEAVNIDSKTGYNFARSVYYNEGGVEKRDLVRYFGVRIAVQSIGEGAKRSFSMIVLQVSSAIALLAVARTAADFFLEKIVPERRHYLAQKVLQADDF
mmetsp:Transcript_24519/g.61722  ORF Transcript_24519/g.61722 Transcript_24519/m.61722 type:complete len:365 (+) Transcript_24519:394-1488(+)|eukprot:CAMPEP_0178985796 /NCGR_PEP_ID=MMETSP0795-20121207/2346_1 /TAXON_ID=88552 /ORGANISM="Amoebophrya sp., Strain Ameob2" /LENGTH=364 /DNA_ID=CAMNT_0020676783 /DNA_START=332 /DNA_END=1426 /DNA_ORIENTATION=+